MRVSTEGQELFAQEKAISIFLRQKDLWNVSVYVDHGYSGSNTNRPQFKMLEDDIKQGKVECLIIWKLDRLSRKLKDLIELLDEFAHKNVKIISLHEQIDMTTPHGIAMVHMIGVFAQLERAMAVDRTKAGIVAYRAKHNKWGRPIAIKDEVKQQITQLRAEGFSFGYIGKKLKISPSTAFKVIKENI